MRKWNLACYRGGWSHTKKLCCPRPPPDLWNPKIKCRALLLPKIMSVFKTQNFLEVHDRIHTIHAQKLPNYVISASSGTLSRFMQATTITLDNISRYVITACSAASPFFQLPVFLGFKILPRRAANQNRLQIIWAIFLGTQFGSAVYKTIHFIADYFRFEVLIGTLLWIAAPLLAAVLIDNWNLQK